MPYSVGWLGPSDLDGIGLPIYNDFLAPDSLALDPNIHQSTSSPVPLYPLLWRPQGGRTLLFQVMRLMC